MYLLIDAYNLLKFKHQKTCISDQERFNFINSFNKYNLNNKDQIFIVFDGGYDYFRTEEKLGRANIVFAGFNKSADDELIILAQKFRNGCLLVTNDNELKKSAASYGAKNISVNLFISIASKFEQVKLSNNKKTIVLKIIKEDNQEVDQLLFNLNYSSKDLIINKEVPKKIINLIDELIKAI